MQHDKLPAVVIRSGVQTGRRIALRKPCATCGRRPDNDISLQDDPLASALHARLTCDAAGQWFIEDADSTNGTFVEADGIRMSVSSRMPLQPGQSFLVGRTLLMLCCPTSGEVQILQSAECGDRCNEFDDHPQPPMHLRVEWTAGQLKLSMLSEKVLARDWTIPLPEEELDEVCGRVESVLAARRAIVPGTARDGLARAGELLARHLLPEPVADVLFAPKDNRLLISHTPALMRVPWELAAREGRHLCLARSLGRQILIDESDCHFKSTCGCREEGILMVADPAEDLPEARLHAEALAQLLRKTWPKLQVTLLAGQQASRLEILQRLPEVRLVYYVGHAVFDSDNPASSGWLLKNGRVTAQDFRRLAAAPSFVFANGCQTSRETAGPECGGWRHGMAGGFILAGVHGYLGAVWPLPIEAAMHFADAWFHELAAGRPVGDCVQRARLATCDRTGAAAAAWPAYTCYGNPAARLVF